MSGKEIKIKGWASYYGERHIGEGDEGNITFIKGCFDKSLKKRKRIPMLL